MKKLLILALAGAFLAPAAATQAKPLRVMPAKHLKLIKKPNFAKKLVLRCHMPRVSVRWEHLRLRRAGFYLIRYQGRKVFLPRCAQFLYFTACKRGVRYRVIVRYIRHSRYVITLRQGRCFPYRPGLPRHYRAPGA